MSDHPIPDHITAFGRRYNLEPETHFRVANGIRYSHCNGKPWADGRCSTCGQIVYNRATTHWRPSPPTERDSAERASLQLEEQFAAAAIPLIQKARAERKFTESDRMIDILGEMGFSVSIAADGHCKLLGR